MRYCETVKKYRLEFTMQGKIETQPAGWGRGGGMGRRGGGYGDYGGQSDMPAELRAAFQQSQRDELSAGFEPGTSREASGHMMGIKAVDTVYTDPKTGKEVAPLTSDMLDKIKPMRLMWWNNPVYWSVQGSPSLSRLTCRIAASSVSLGPLHG